jgi:hypothetical protein
MLVTINCEDCDTQFGVRGIVVNTKKGEVRSKFGCPYCGKTFNSGDKLDIRGTQGGVNIKGKASVGGGIVSGNKVSYE